MGISEIELAAAVERFAFLDDLGAYLAMPGAAGDWPHWGERPLYELYGEAPADEDGGGSPYIVRLARQVHAFVDTDKAFQNGSMSRMMQKMFRVRPLAALGNLLEVGWRETVQERAMVYDLAFVLNSGLGARELIQAVQLGDEEALLEMVKVDKSVLGAPWAAAILKERQFGGDWAFFERLSYSVRRQPVSKRAKFGKEVLLVALFWEEHFSGCTLDQTVEMLKPHCESLAEAVDYDNFRRALNRAGLKKRRYNRRIGHEKNPLVS